MKKKNKLKENKLYNFDVDINTNKNKKKRIAKKEIKKNKNDNKIKYDDEIIIGVTKFPEKEKNREKNKKDKKIKEKKIEKLNNKKNNVKDRNKPIKRTKRICIIIIIFFIVLAINLMLLSPIFNIRKIIVSGNKKITKEEIINLSGLKMDYNILKINNIEVINKIKENLYIEKVEINRKFPDTIEISIIEREPYYIIEYGGGYIYIDNNGYVLEISEQKADFPILIGITTLKDNLRKTKRLEDEDLLKLSILFKLIKFAKLNRIEDRITKIDISNENNYILYLEKDRKKAYMGNCDNIETRMLYLIGILEKEKDKEGEIFINMNLNNENPYFRENV